MPRRGGGRGGRVYAWRVRGATRRSYLLPTLITVALFALMLALAVVQWRWIGRVSAMERQRMLSSLQSAGSRFAEDFDREVARAALYFHPERGPHGGPPFDAPDGGAGEVAAHERARLARLAGQLQRWEAEAPFPQLVSAIEVARVAGDGEPQLARLGPDGVLAPLPWPPELAPLRERLARGPDAPRPAEDDPAEESPVPPDLAEQSWSLVLPFSFSRVPRSGAGRSGVARSYVVVELDRRALEDEVFPELMRRHFGSAVGEDYVVAVIDPRDPERGEQPSVVFRSDPTGPAIDRETADLQLGLFSARPFEDLRNLVRTSRAHRSDWPRLAPPRGRGVFAWSLLARRRDGSLEAAVAAARHRNLEVSIAILSLIAVTAGILAFTAQRAQRLARQQIEFVAGVSHELNTPLAAIRSAGENLADGVVTDPAQVRRYGALIENEGRRLSSMVGQVLEFAGMQSRRREQRNERVAVADLIERALTDARWLLEENRVTVEHDVAAGLPALVGDPRALQRALQNLLENAVKYGARAGWVGVSASPGAGGGVDIAVLDRGPGLSRDELSHLFEPFFRGRDAAASGIPGSGLGLSLVRHIVEAHGGSVSAGANPQGSGSAFRIHLPPAPPEAVAGAAAGAMGDREPA